MAITIDITDRATPLMAEVRGAITGVAINNAMGRGAVNVIQAHLFGLNGSRANKLGGRRTHFYSSAAKATHYQSTPGEIRVSINHLGFRQRLEGGAIHPVRSKYLTIPARAEAHGRRASEFNDLVMIFGKGGRPVGLAQANQTGVKFGRVRKDGTRKTTQNAETGGLVMFWLVKTVTQRADPSVMPATQQIADAAIAAGRAYIDTVIKRTT